MRNDSVKSEKITWMYAYILGGGKSNRMGRDKAFLKFGSKNLLDIVIECTSKIFKRVFLVGREYKSPLLTDSFYDEIEEIGPMGGIYTALKKTDEEFNFFIGMDYPFIDPEIVHQLAIITLEKSKDYKGFVPLAPDGLHPAFAIYGKSCLSGIKRCIELKNYTVNCIAYNNRIYYIDMVSLWGEKSLAKLRKNFININSYEEYEKTKKLWKRIKNS